MSAERLENCSARPYGQRTSTEFDRSRFSEAEMQPRVARRLIAASAQSRRDLHAAAAISPTLSHRRHHDSRSSLPGEV